ncbi:MAG: DNA polymerase I [Polyangiaceae bacterium]|nr:DNA polymerase I [Polyangiaceae bacterium]
MAMETVLFARGAPDVLYLVDLSGYVLRAYHAIDGLTSPTGEPTNAVFGTVNMLERLVRERQPALLGVAMDSGRQTFRSELYPDYKANRPPVPDDLVPQFGRCEQIVDAFGIPVLRQPGVEADDLIACAVDRALERELNVVIVTADKDLMQLVSPRVLVWDTMRDKVTGPDEVQTRYGVPPEQLRDLLALVGDTSDNVPGVPSVGPKTATQLLQAYGSIENVYARLDSIEKKKLREVLAVHREQAFISQKLVTLRRDLTIEFDIDRLRYRGRDARSLERIYAELGFTRHLEAVRRELAGPGEPSSISAAKPSATTGAVRQDPVIRPTDLAELAQRARDVAVLAVCAETSAASPMNATLVGLSLALGPNAGCYIPVGHRSLVSGPQCSLAELAATIGPLLADPRIAKVGHDVKRSMVILRRHGMPVQGVLFDVELASYLLDPDRDHTLEGVARAELGVELGSWEALLRGDRGRRFDLDEIDPNRAGALGAARAEAVLALRPRLEQHLENARLNELLGELELPLVPILAEMQMRGVLVDVERLVALGRDCEGALLRLEQEAHQVAGRSFNVHAPRQLETLLFDELGLKPLKRTKTARSTDAATLESLAEQHALPRLILEIRQLAKLKGTYIDALPALVNPTTGRVHTTWAQTVAATGRLSSVEPNLQNIPVRSELGRSIRGAFVAPPGCSLVSADYSQIELRVLAHLSHDPVLLDAFRSGQDVHTRTAMEVFGVGEDGVTPEMRRRAKAVNFGVIYGQGDSGLAKSLGIARSEAGRFIEAYFGRYRGVREFMDRTLDVARAGEGVRSLFGRQRLVPDITHGNRARRLAAERVAMNMPIQATAADLLKRAMIALGQPVTPGARLVLTVHDELVFEVPNEELGRAKSLIREAMQTVYPLDVPLVVDVGSGPDWSAAH